jgi:hypothetical protein
LFPRRPEIVNVYELTAGADQSLWEVSMTRLLTSFFIAFCLFSGASLSAKAQSVDEQVKAAYAAWDDAFNKGDAKAVAAFYTDNATFLPATHDVV